MFRIRAGGKVKLSDGALLLPDADIADDPTTLSDPEEYWAALIEEFPEVAERLGGVD